MGNFADPANIPAGWDFIRASTSEELAQGMNVAVYKNQTTHQIVIAYGPIDPPGFLGSDGIAYHKASHIVTQQLLSGTPVDQIKVSGSPQGVFALAQSFATDLITRVADPTDPLYDPLATYSVSGESWGGALAQYVGGNLELGGVTFGALMIPNGAVSDTDVPIVNYINYNDPFSNAQISNAQHIGSVIFVGGPIGTSVVSLSPKIVASLLEKDTVGGALID
jgi:hypothetical protein